MRIWPLRRFGARSSPSPTVSQTVRSCRGCDSIGPCKQRFGSISLREVAILIHGPTTILPGSMTTRPADLPDFVSPPVTEVVLGVQFNSLDRLFSPHLGLVWEVFKDEFPLVEDHPYFPPAFETFGTPAPFMIPGVNFQILARPEMARTNFLNREKTQALQVQRDRFLHNWRKTGEGDDYPRFERMIETFSAGFGKFTSVVDRENLGPVIPNQCEVTYFNQIPVPENETIWSQFALTFPDMVGNGTIEELGAPEDARFVLRYVISADGGLLGRVTVAAQPARRADGVTIIQFTLTARGKPITLDVSGVLDFLAHGRILLNRVFKKLTSPTMQQRWGRK
jgi:uncharacterized protein (TIGR04255 family)